MTETYFEHGREECRFLGFFIEGFKDGAVSASPIIHSANKRILSVSSFLWKVGLFLSLTSSMLKDFLLSMNAYESKSTEIKPTGDLEQVAFILAKLPFYSLDDENPFAETKLVLQFDDLPASSESIYGSAFNKWADGGEGKLIKTENYFNGDGVSAKFEISVPSTISLNRLH